MSKDKVANNIDKLVSIERKVNALHDKLSSLELQWIIIHDQVKNTAQWDAHCKFTGYDKHYQFRDLD